MTATQRTVTVCACVVTLTCSAGLASAQNLIFRDGFASGDATAWTNYSAELCDNGLDDDGDGWIDCDSRAP